MAGIVDSRRSIDRMSAEHALSSVTTGVGAPRGVRSYRICIG